MVNDFVTINDVGPRDGLQNDPTTVTVEDRVRLITALVDAGVPAVEAASFVSPRAVPKMAGATELFAALDQGKAELSALVPNRKGYEMARSAGARSIAVVLSATDTMNRKNINMTLDETISTCTDIMQQANVDGLLARAYISVAVECPFEGLVSPDVVERLAEQMFRHGAQECIIADTIGAANPAQVKILFGRLVKSFETARLSAHFHDTRAMALANIWQAVESGVRKFDASIGGLGGCPFAPGAAGNVATEDVVYMLEQAGLDTGINMNKLMRCVDLVESMVSHPAGGRTRAYQLKQIAG